MWKAELPRVRDRSKMLRVRHTNLFFAMALSLAGAVAIAIIAAWLLAPLLNVGTQATAPADLTRIALTIAGGVGGVVALVVAYRRQRDLEQGRFLEGFGAAAKQLGDPDVAVRLAGVYAMAGVADQTSNLQQQQCVDVLCGYLRLPYSPELGNNHQQSLVLKMAPEPGSEGIERELHFQYRQNDKVVRQTIVRVIASHLWKKAAHSWSSNDFDFTGAHLEDPNFNQALFNGRSTYYIGTTFSGEKTSFAGATFSGGVTVFRQASFNAERTSFVGTTFTCDHTEFIGATFSGKNTQFAGATFSSERTYFVRATFNSMWTSFNGAAFRGKSTLFDNTDFGKGEVSFEAPEAWDPAPRFDWDEGGVAKPANVKPHDWPPVAAFVSEV